MDEKTKQKIGLFRIAVLGPLVGAELEHGDLVAYCREAAHRRWEWPDGSLRTISARTIEGWYYAYRRHGFAGLLPKDRKDLGTSRIPPELADLIIRAKRERPRRSLKRIIGMLERARAVSRGELSHSAVHRLLLRQGLSGRPKRGPTAERRSFLYLYPGELLLGDSLHVRPKVIRRDGRVGKAYLLSQIDCASRYVPESYLSFKEDAPAHERGFKQVLLTHGRPYKYYVDLGPAYIAHSLRLICAELDIELLHAGPRDAAAKGAIERWHRTWREEVEDELPGGPIPIEELEAKHRAWLTCEYHVRQHETTKRAPREHWLEYCDRLRPLPRGVDLDQVFLHRATRTVSATSTVRWRGAYIELTRPDLAGQKVELRYDPNRPEALPRVFVEGRFVCDTVPLDLYRNAHRKRRRDLGAPEPLVEPTGIDPLDMLVQEHQGHTRPLDTLALKEPDDEDPHSNEDG